MFIVQPNSRDSTDNDVRQPRWLIKQRELTNNLLFMSTNMVAMTSLANKIYPVHTFGYIYLFHFIFYATEQSKIP